MLITNEEKGTPIFFEHQDPYNRKYCLRQWCTYTVNAHILLMWSDKRHVAATLLHLLLIFIIELERYMYIVTAKCHQVCGGEAPDRTFRFTISGNSFRISVQCITAEVSTVDHAISSRVGATFQVHKFLEK